MFGVDLDSALDRCDDDADDDDDDDGLSKNVTVLGSERFDDKSVDL